MQLYAIIYLFGTNLLTQCPVQLLFFLLVFVFSENHYQKVSKREKNFGLIFSGPKETHDASGEDQRSYEGATSSGGVPPGLVVPSWLFWPFLEVSGVSFCP